MTGVYEIRPAQWWDWPFHGVVAEQASIPAVTTLPASDEDQRAVTVRFSYPRPGSRGEVRELRAWKESAMSVLDEWHQVWETLGKPGRLGDSLAIASKKEIERRKWLERAGQ